MNVVPCDWYVGGDRRTCGDRAYWRAARHGSNRTQFWCDRHALLALQHAGSSWAIGPIDKRERGDENRSLHNGAEEAGDNHEVSIYYAKENAMCTGNQYDFGGDTDNRDGQGAGNAFVAARDAYLAEAASLRREALFLRADADAKDTKANVIIGEVGDPLDSDSGGGS